MTATAFAATAPGDGNGYVITIHPGSFTDTTKTDRFKAYEVFTGKLTEPGAVGNVFEYEVYLIESFSRPMWRK